MGSAAGLLTGCLLLPIYGPNGVEHWQDSPGVDSGGEMGEDRSTSGSFLGGSADKLPDILQFYSFLLQGYEFLQDFWNVLYFALEGRGNTAVVPSATPHTFPRARLIAYQGSVVSNSQAVCRLQRKGESRGGKLPAFPGGGSEEERSREAQLRQSAQVRAEICF